MHLLTLGLNHTTAPLEVRERVAFPADRLCSALGEMRQSLKRWLPESAILSTCNRTEIYCATEAPAELQPHLTSWLAQWGTLPAPELSPHLYSLPQSEAVRHAFRVASGLDSMVLGEPQILGQMKDAVRSADEAGSLGTHLHQLFQRTFAVAKEVRSTTEIGAHSVSMAAAAVRLAQRIFDDLSRTSMLFVGAGEMIELCATHFAAQQPRRLVVANRTLERAESLANRFSGKAMRLADLPDSIEQFDIVVSCTASTLPIIGLGMVARAVKARRHKPVFMVDLAVPRDIEPEVARLDDVFLYTVDDLGRVVQAGIESRQVAVSQAEAIIENRVNSFMQWLDQRSIVPAIRDLHAQGERMRQVELERARRMLAKGESIEQVLEAMSNGLAAKFLHGPTALLHHVQGEERRRLVGLLPELYRARIDEHLLRPHGESGEAGKSGQAQGGAKVSAQDTSGA